MIFHLYQNLLRFCLRDLVSREMEKSLVSLFCFLLPALILAPISKGQLNPSESGILFEVQKLLEYPAALQEWTNWTDFCYLPQSPSLRIVCSEDHITELTVVGNKSSPSDNPKPVSANLVPSQQTLSKSFSIDSLFTVLTKLPNLKVLSLVSLGLWGPLPPKISRFSSLEVLNISSNFIYGKIPTTISRFQNLTSLVLAGNLFNSTVPDLTALTLVEELDLSGNHLGPEFPSLGNNLVSINLRKNSFRSELPSRIKDFIKLQRLDISGNKFLGPTPASLFSLPSIQSLNLAFNQLSGVLSVNTTCNRDLDYVDISHNLLMGKLPACIGTNSANRTVISSWNCLSSGNPKTQHPYSFCHSAAMAVKPPLRNQKQQPGNKLALMLGIIAGIVGVAVVFLFFVLAIVRRTGRRNPEESKFTRSVADKSSVRGSPLSTIEARRVPQRMRTAPLGLPPYRVFGLEEIEEATNNFDPANLIGEGSQGQVYRGRLSDGSEVLVKSIKLRQKHSPQALAQQAEVLPNLRHRHLVSVLGHCTVSHRDHPLTAATVFVVLEHVCHSSLKDYLLDWRRKETLKWPQRMSITIGVAKGVQFLHAGIAPAIYGNNLEVGNIVLNETLSAKISNYNIPFKIGSESPLKGPDGHGRIESAEKEDIYQLGVILLEVITGRPVTSTSELEDLKYQLERGLAEATSKLRAVIDPSIQGSFAYDSLKTMVQIAINCLSKEPSERPSIEDVLWNLQYSMQVQEGWTSSGNIGL